MSARHIQQIREAIERTEREITRMASALGPDQCQCCVGAAYGGTDGPFDTMLRKLVRQEAWLDILLAKASGDAAELARASRAYTEATLPH